MAQIEDRACAWCEAQLTPRKVRFCSRDCSRAAWRSENKEKWISYTQDWKARNPEKYQALYKEQNRKRSKEIAAFTNQRHKERREADPAFALLHRLRVRLNHALGGKAKASTTMDLVGCTAQELVAHMEAQFLPGMAWENRGEWHVDHIRPCSSFDFSDPEQQRACFHYSNLQPLWAVDNQRKGARLAA